MGKALPLKVRLKMFHRIGLVALIFGFGTCFATVVWAKPGDAESKALTIAKKAFQDSQYDVAATKLQDFQKTYPKSDLIPEAGLLLGQSFFFQGTKEKALEIFQNPPSGLSDEQKGDYLFWKAETLFSQEKWDLSAETYRTFIKAHPANPHLNEALLHLSEALLSNTHPDEAQDILTPLLALKTTDKQRHPAVLQMARIFTSTGNYTEAINLLNLLLEEKLERSVLYPAAYLAGEVSLQTKNAAEAKLHFNKITGDGRAYPKSLVAKAWLGTGTAEEALQKWSQAADAYEKALEFSDQPALVESSVVRYLNAHTKSATLAKGTLKVRQLARDRKEIGPIGFYAIGKFYFDAKNYDAAISEMDNFINSNPDSSWATTARLLIADCLYQKKDTEAAITAFNDLIKQKKSKETVLQARLRLAEISYERADYPVAAENFLAVSSSDSALSGLPEEAGFRGLVSLARSGNLEEFAQQFKLFSTKFPASSRLGELQLEQAALLDQAGKGDEARKLYEAVAISSADNKAEALLRLGRSALQAPADYNKAISTLTMLEKEYPNYPYLDQAVSMRIRAQMESQQFKDKEAEARTEYGNFISRFPDSGEVPLMYLQIAQSFSSEGNHAEAQIRFEKLAADFPKAANNIADYALYSAGRSAMAQAEYKQAVQILEKISQESPVKTSARLAQIRCYMSQNNYLDAIRICDSILLNRKEDDAWVDASIRKANCLYTLAAEDPGKYQQALEVASQVFASKEAAVHQRNEAGHLKGAILQKLNRMWFTARSSLLRSPDRRNILSSIGLSNPACPPPPCVKTRGMCGVLSKFTIYWNV
jgi:TolA-binding protein